MQHAVARVRRLGYHLAHELPHWLYNESTAGADASGDAKVTKLLLYT